MTTNYQASADTSAAVLRYVTETAPGTKASTALTNLRFTGESLQSNRTSTQSKEIRSDYQISDLITTGQSAAGTVNGEFSFKEYDPIMELLFRGKFDVNGVLKNGTTRGSIFIEKGFTDVGSYFGFGASEVTKGSWEYKVDTPVSFNFDVMCRSFASSTSTVSTSIVPSQTYTIYNSIDDVQNILFNGVALTQGIQDFKINIDNNAREQKQIGSRNLAGVGMGQFAVTGSLQAYFLSASAMNAVFDADGYASFSIDVIRDGNGYTFTFPKVKFSSEQANAGAVNADVVMTLNWQAVADPVTGCTAMITRHSAS